MRHLYAVESESELSAYQPVVQRLQPRLEAYLCFLKEQYAVAEWFRIE